MKLQRLNEIRLITQNFHFFHFSSNLEKKFLSLIKKKQQKFVPSLSLALPVSEKFVPSLSLALPVCKNLSHHYLLLFQFANNLSHHYLLLFQFAKIKNQPNATFSAFLLNYFCINFICIRNCTTLILCNKVGLFRKVFILV